MKPTTARIIKTALFFLLAFFAIRGNLFGIYDAMFEDPDMPKVEEPSLIDDLFDFEEDEEGYGGVRSRFLYPSYFYVWDLEDFLPRTKNYKAMEDDNIREY
jgi:hypothetical protein